MYFVYLFIKDEPHIEENIVSGYYTTCKKDVFTFLQNVDFETHSVVIEFDDELTQRCQNTN